MGEEDVFDLQIVFGREGEIAIDIALGINDGGYVGLPIADEVRGVGKAVQIELVEDHGGAVLRNGTTQDPHAPPACGALGQAKDGFRQRARQRQPQHLQDRSNPRAPTKAYATRKAAATKATWVGRRCANKGAELSSRWD